MNKRFTTEEYREKLAIEHPNLELLSEYNGDKNYITVRCKIHDYVFNTKPNWLKHGAGCQKCYDDRRGNATRKTTEQFIAEARAIHGDKYDYSKVVYVNSTTKVCIICPIHGEFWIKPCKHLSGQGCRECARVKNGIAKRMPWKTVLERFRKVHGDKYTYDESTYVSLEVPMKMFCPIHGEFWQKPCIHIDGSACPKCNESHLERDVRLYLESKKGLYVYQANKHDLPILKRQTLDFYLPEIKLAIECQGGQHFKSVDHFGGDKGYKDVKRRDKRKKELLSEGNIKLIYFVDDDVDIEKLDKTLYSAENTFHISDVSNII